MQEQVVEDQLQAVVQDNSSYRLTFN
jgi:hypothetical protein